MVTGAPGASSALRTPPATVPRIALHHARNRSEVEMWRCLNGSIVHAIDRTCMKSLVSSMILIRGTRSILRRALLLFPPPPMYLSLPLPLPLLLPAPVTTYILRTPQA